MLKLTRRKGN